MTPLILFSGGIESTLLIHQAPKNSIVLSINPAFNNELQTYHSENSNKILQHYGLKRYTSIMKLNIPCTEQYTFVHQMRVFVSIANLWCSKLPITEVWCGRNISEPNNDIKPFIEQMMDAWTILHPNIPFNHPNEHLTRKEQYDLIPTKIQTLVSSCIYHKKCGKCFKCKEQI